MKNIIYILIFKLIRLFRKPQIEHLDYNISVDQYAYELIWANMEEPYLKELLNEFKLDQLVKGCKSDYEKILTVTNWVHGLWKHSSSNIPSHNDPITILNEVKKGHRFRCVEYSTVLTGCLNALGIHSRVVSLIRKNVEKQTLGASHVISEVYLKDLGKWIFIDPQWNVIPKLNGVPLHSVELQVALYEKKEIEFDSLLKTKKQKKYPKWIAEYLYYFVIKIDNRYTTYDDKRLMLVPLGVKSPKVVQRKYPIGNIVYTNSINTFYPQIYHVKPDLF